MNRDDMLLIGVVIVATFAGYFLVSYLMDRMKSPKLVAKTKRDDRENRDGPHGEG